jgi:hypothetical protein
MSIGTKGGRTRACVRKAGWDRVVQNPQTTVQTATLEGYVGDAR